MEFNTAPEWPPRRFWLLAVAAGAVIGCLPSGAVLYVFGGDLLASVLTALGIGVFMFLATLLLRWQKSRKPRLVQVSPDLIDSLRVELADVSPVRAKQLRKSFGAKGLSRADADVIFSRICFEVRPELARKMLLLD